MKSMHRWPRLCARNCKASKTFAQKGKSQQEKKHGMLLCERIAATQRASRLFVQHAPHGEDRAEPRQWLLTAVLSSTILSHDGVVRRQAFQVWLFRHPGHSPLWRFCPGAPDTRRTVHSRGWLFLRNTAATYGFCKYLPKPRMPPSRLFSAQTVPFYPCIPHRKNAVGRGLRGFARSV